MYRKSNEDKVINVYLTNSSLDTMSRSELLNWVNTTLNANFVSVEEMCTGAAYCQLLDMLFPGSIPLNRVRFTTNLEHEFVENFKLVQAAFDQLNIQKFVSIDKLTRGKFQDNFDFLQWFKKFFDANIISLDYDALNVRNGAPMAYATSIGVNFGLVAYKPRASRSLSCHRRASTTTTGRSNATANAHAAAGTGTGAATGTALSRSVSTSRSMRPSIEHRSSNCSINNRFSGRVRLANGRNSEPPLTDRSLSNSYRDINKKIQEQLNIRDADETAAAAACKYFEEVPDYEIDNTYGGDGPISPFEKEGRGQPNVDVKHKEGKQSRSNKSKKEIKATQSSQDIKMLKEKEGKGDKRTSKSCKR